MKKYTKHELADEVQKRIRQRFGNPEQIKNEFKSNIQRKLQSVDSTKPTEAELENKIIKVAEGVHDQINRISNEMIIGKISRKIKDDNYYTGIDISQYADYLEELAKEFVKALINHQYSSAKKRFNEYKKKMGKKIIFSFFPVWFLPICIDRA